MTNTPFALVEDTRRRLIDAAHKVRENAYAPYSHYLVGAALLARDGRIFTGCNVENAVYPATICAERTAVTKAVSEGARQFDAVAVVTENGGTPCGICRQVMYEFAQNMLVVVADTSGKIIHELPLRELLAYGFGPEKLENLTGE